MTDTAIIRYQPLTLKDFVDPEVIKDLLWLVLGESVNTHSLPQYGWYPRPWFVIYRDDTLLKYWHH